MADHSYSSERVRHRWKDHCYFSFAKKTPKVVLEKSGLPQSELVSHSLDHTYVKLSPVAVALSCDQDDEEMCGVDTPPAVVVLAGLPAVVGQDHSYGFGASATDDSSLIIWSNRSVHRSDLDYGGLALYAVDDGEESGEDDAMGDAELVDGATHERGLTRGIYLKRMMERHQTPHHDHTYLMYKTWHNDHTYMPHSDVYVASLPSHGGVSYTLHHNDDTSITIM